MSDGNRPAGPWTYALALPAEPRRVEFYRMVCEFNLRPDAYLHVTRVPPEWPAEYHQLSRFGDAGRRLIARHLLATNGLAADSAGDAAHAMDFEAATPLARLALLPGAALEQLASYAGLLLHRAWLRDTLHQRRVRVELAAKLGEDALELTLERAPEFGALGETLEPWHADPAALPALIRARGGRLLADFIDTAGGAVGRRARLKFNRAIDDEVPYLLNHAQRDQFGELLFLFLIPERFAAWDWLF